MMHHDHTNERLQQQLVEARKRITELEALVEGSAPKVERKASENLVQALLNSSLQPILIIDRSGTLLAINDICARGLGHEPSEMLGRCVYDFLPPDVAKRRRAFAEKVVRTGKPIRFEDERQGKRIDNTVYPVSDAAGQTTRLLVYVDDITERKRAEDKLQESEAMLARAQAMAHVGHWERDLASGRVRWSDETYRIFGLLPQQCEVHGRFLFDHIHPEDRSSVEKAVQDAAEGIRPYDEIYRVIRPDGTIHWVHARGEVIRSQEEKPLRLFGTILDITDRKQAEEALRESEQRFAAFMDNSPALAWMKDEEGRYVYLNKKYENTFNIRLADWLGKTDYEVWPSEIAERFRQTDRAVMKHGKPIQIVEETVDANGRHHYLLNSKFLLSDYRGGRYVAGIGVDITKHKQADEKVHHLNRELAQRVGELKDINEGLQTFSYSLSHDLRTPLVAIRGFSRRLLDKYALHLDERGQQYLKIVNENSMRMEALIAELLVFFKMEKKTVQLSHINMGDTVQEIFHQLRASYPNRTIQLDIKTLPDTEGDEAMIRNVFMNLFDNAVKYSRPRDVTVIEVAGRVEKERTVYYVKDNGIGFPMEQVTKLFKPFERLHITEDIEGAGLGLAIVRRIIRRHGGDVWAEARVDEGATFYFSVPR